MRRHLVIWLESKSTVSKRFHLRGRPRQGNPGTFLGIFRGHWESPLAQCLNRNLTVRSCVPENPVLANLGVLHADVYAHPLETPVRKTGRDLISGAHAASHGTNRAQVVESQQGTREATGPTPPDRAETRTEGSQGGDGTNPPVPEKYALRGTHGQPAVGRRSPYGRRGKPRRSALELCRTNTTSCICKGMVIIKHPYARTGDIIETFLFDGI